MRPYVTINTAISADGKLSTRERRQVRISGDTDFDRVDVLKAGSDAIMVGIGTVLADNPSLTVKSETRISERVREGLDEHPVRIVIDSAGRTPVDSKILHKGTGKRIIAVSRRAPDAKIKELEQYADVIIAGEKSVDLKELLNKLSERGINRLMVEGGGTLIWSLLSQGLADELITFVGNIIIGGKDAPTLADGEGFTQEKDFPALKLVSAEPVEEGILIIWKTV